MKERFAVICILLFVFTIFAENHELIKCYKLDESVKSGEVECNLWIYEIDGCEYIGPSSFVSMQFLTHKGNCKYCVARQDSLAKRNSPILAPTSGGYFSRYGK